jgi:hypothetical protein
MESGEIFDGRMACPKCTTPSVLAHTPWVTMFFADERELIAGIGLCLGCFAWLMYSPYASGAIEVIDEEFFMHMARKHPCFLHLLATRFTLHIMRFGNILRARGD